MAQILQLYRWQLYDSSEFFQKVNSFVNECTDEYALLRNQKKICLCLNNFINKEISDPISFRYSKSLSKTINILNWRLAQFAKNGVKNIFQRFELLLARMQKHNFDPQSQFNHFQYTYSSINKLPKKNYLINDLSDPIFLKKKQTSLQKLYKKEGKELFTFKGNHDPSERFLKDILMGKKALGSKNCLGCCEFLYEGQKILDDDCHDIICYEDLKDNKKEIVCGINALANSRGGIILIGIKDNKVQGIQNKQKLIGEQLNRLQQQLKQTCSLNNRHTLIEQKTIYYSVIGKERKTDNEQTEEKVKTNKTVIGIQVPYMQKVSYIEMDRQGKVPLYECYYKLDISNGPDSIFEYTNNDIYNFILRKYASKRKNLVHYNLQCQRQDSKFIIKEKSGQKTDQSQNPLMQQDIIETVESQAPKFKYGVEQSILIIKNDKAKQKDTLLQRKQEALNFLLEKDLSIVCQEIYGKIQNEGGNYNSWVYFIEHRKSAKQLARHLKKKASGYAKLYEVSNTILITDENVAKLNIDHVKDKYKLLVKQESRTFSSGKCNIKVSQNINQKWTFLQFQNSLSQALYILVCLRANGVKCVFANSRQVEIEHETKYKLNPSTI